MAEIVIGDLTQTTLTGTGVFDVLMRATKAHLESEFTKNRIKGAEYSSVYLGSLQAVMTTSLDFLMRRQEIDLQAKLLEQQIILAQVEVQKANAELKIVEANLAKIPLELAQITAQTDLVKQQTENALAELAIIQANALKIPAEIAHLNAQTDLTKQQKTNLITTNLQTEAQTLLTKQQTANALTENSVLLAQECKLKAEFDLLILQKSRTTVETNLLQQKIVTEQAQTIGSSAEDNSILGRQKGLYLAQTNGFSRDAEQKATKIMADFWNVQRTTDEGIAPSEAAGNTDVYIGRAVKKMLSGVGA